MSKNKKKRQSFQEGLEGLRKKEQGSETELSAEEKMLRVIFGDEQGLNGGYMEVCIPPNVSVDATFSIWLAEKKFLISSSTEIRTTSAFNPEKRQPRILYLNVAKGFLDHHGRGKMCTVDLMFRHFKWQKSAVMADFVNYVRMQDLRGKNEVKNSNLRIFLPPIMIRGLKLAGFNSEDIVAFMNEWWSGLFWCEHYFSKKDQLPEIENWVQVKAGDITFTAPLTLATTLAIYLLHFSDQKVKISQNGIRQIMLNEKEEKSDKALLQKVLHLNMSDIQDEKQKMVLKKIVDKVCSNLSYDVNSVQDRILHPENALRGMMIDNNKTLVEIADIMHDFWHAIFCSQYDFWVTATEEVKKSLKLYVRYVKKLNRKVTVAMIHSTSYSAVPALNYLTTHLKKPLPDIVIVDRGTGGVQISSRTFDLRDVAAYVRMEEAVQHQRRLLKRVCFRDLTISGMVKGIPEWFLIDPEPETDKCRLLLSRSEAAPDMPKSVLTIEQIVKSIFISLNHWRPRGFCYKRGKDLQADGSVCVGPKLCPFFSFDIPACYRPKERARQLGLNRKKKL